MSRQLRRFLLLLLLVATVGCDQTTKHVARTSLLESESVTIPGGWGELRLVENPGAFLSLGAALPPAARTLVLTLGVATGLLLLFLYLMIRTRWNWLVFVGLALVLAGGISNLIDRVLRHGLVTDFITMRIGPIQTGVFNVADVVVLTGVGLLTLALWKQSKPGVVKPSSVAGD